jgi:hypothetical protein
MITVKGKQQNSISRQSVPECFSHCSQPAHPSLHTLIVHTHIDKNGEGQPFSSFRLEISVMTVSKES